MNIVEIFYSLQGEGRLTGVPSVFVRVAGCPLRCTWCDTVYAQDPSAGEDLSVEDILEKTASLQLEFAVQSEGVQDDGFFIRYKHRLLPVIGADFGRDEGGRNEGNKIHKRGSGCFHGLKSVVV